MLSILGIASIPTTIGVAEGVTNRSKPNDPEKANAKAEQMRKFNLQCYCKPNTPTARKLDGGRVVLRDGNLHISPPSSPRDDHPFEGFYITYPDPERPQPPPLGCVSTIGTDPPMLNWIYVDKNTREVRYGNRTKSREHIVGSWGWEAGEEGGPGGLTLDGEEGAVAVETDSGWEMRWEDGNRRYGAKGKECLGVSLERKMLEPSPPERYGE